MRTLTAVAAVGSGALVGVLAGMAASSTPGRQQPPAPAPAPQSADALQVLQLRAPDAVPVAAGQRSAVATTGGS